MTAYGPDGGKDRVAGGWPFFFMIAEEAVKSGQALGMRYGKNCWDAILKNEKGLIDKLDKLMVRDL